MQGAKYTLDYECRSTCFSILGSIIGPACIARAINCSTKDNARSKKNGTG